MKLYKDTAMQNETDDLEKVINEINAYMIQDGVSMLFPFIVDAPKGIKQPCDMDLFDHEYVDQSTGVSCDDYYGTMYFPLKSGKYIAVDYHM